jgi:hypothetical protein
VRPSDPDEQLPLIGPKSAQVGKQNPGPGPRRGLHAVRAAAREKAMGRLYFQACFRVMNSKISYFSVQILFKFELIL